MRPEYDVIVVGCGGVGSAALYFATQRAERVLGLDRFPAAHDRGSSHGQTRIIRQAYFEHPDYVPLLLHAYQGWADLERLTGRQLYHRTGLLEAGPADGVVAPGVLEADRLHGLGVETFEFKDAAKRFPEFRMEPDWLIVFEPQAGYLLVEQCVQSYLDVATDAGAEHRTGVEVHSYHAEKDHFVVTANGEQLTAERLIICPGAWAGDLLGDLLPPLRVLRKHLHWYAAPADQFQPSSCPAYLFETEQGCFYGFPVCDDRGAKIAEHSGGELIEEPLNASRETDPDDLKRVESFIARHLNLPTIERTDHTTCFYTCTPNDHFLVDQHPNHDKLAFAAGLSGHGFKFAPVLGQALVQLVFDNGSPYPLKFLSL